MLNPAADVGSQLTKNMTGIDFIFALIFDPYIDENLLQFLSNIYCKKEHKIEKL